jgi:hypothetical protein
VTRPTLFLPPVVLAIVEARPVDGDTIALNITSHNSRIQQQMKENNNRFSVKKMFTGKAVLPILFLIVGVIVATFQIRGKSQSLVRNKGMKDRCIVEANSLLLEIWARLLHVCVFLLLTNFFLSLFAALHRVKQVLFRCH